LGKIEKGANIIVVCRGKNEGGRKMNLEKIKEFIALRQELKAAGVIGVSLFNDSFQVRTEVLVGQENLQVEYNEGQEYPYRVTAAIDGVDMMAVMKKEEFEKSFPEYKGFLVEDVDLSGGAEYATA
jgi:hypothetical protein